MRPGDPRFPQRCWAEIDLGALERNLHAIRAALPPGIRYVAVVKADAYGHGLHQTVARLMQAGVDAFAVANLAEAAAIREIGSGWPILVLSALLPEEFPLALAGDVTPTVSTVEEVGHLAAAAAAAGRVAPLHLKIDTGMGRLGVWHEHAAPLCARILADARLRLDGVFTHFSSAESDPAYTDRQRSIFLDTLERLGLRGDARRLIHADNSAGLASFAPGSPFNAVRVGLLQFGVLPYPESLLGRVRTEPVLSFHARVGIVKALPAGTSISYGRTHRLARDARVAVVTAGYGDGVPLAASNRGAVLIRGRRCPILGRVTMDQTIVDVTDLPAVGHGDHVVLIGRQLGETVSIEEFSLWGQTIPWETFCSLTKRVPRLYHVALGT